MEDFKRKVIQYVGFDEINSILDYAKEYCGLVFRSPENNEAVRGQAFISDRMTEFHVTLKYNSVRPTEYIFRKDGEEPMQTISGVDAYIELARDFHRITGDKIPVFEDPQQFGSAHAILRFRTSEEGKRAPAISYDENSAYAFAMCQDMPDTRELIDRRRKPKSYEMGFINIEDYFPGRSEWTGNPGVALQLVEPEDDTVADYIFYRMQSPFESFAHRHYARKRDSTDPAVRKRSKEMLNFSVGYLQRVNPFLRAAIIGHANRKIEKLIDKDTIYCNTDCIVSREPRSDLPIGFQMGQFKVEHEGLFAFTGFNYQWDFNKPAYRGIPKSWFKEGWDILKDAPPHFGNVYRFNKLEVKIEKEHYTKAEEGGRVGDTATL